MKNNPTVSIIAAIDDERGIGFRGKIPWHISEDLKRFKQITLGHPMIMGRKTYESIGKPLPGRTNIVITKDTTFKAEGCVVVHSVRKALDIAASENDDEIFIIGGADIYKQTIEMADKLYLTKVKGTYNADRFFPKFDQFTEIFYKKEIKDDQAEYTFLELKKHNDNSR